MKLLQRSMALFLSCSLVPVGAADGFAYPAAASVSQPPPLAARESSEQLQQLVAVPRRFDCADPGGLNLSGPSCRSREVDAAK